MAYTLSQCVWFDLETTGLNSHKCQMTQICAVHNDIVFMRFVTPNCPIDPKASEIINDLTIRSNNLVIILVYSKMLIPIVNSNS